MSKEFLSFSSHNNSTGDDQGLYSYPFSMEDDYKDLKVMVRHQFNDFNWIRFFLQGLLNSHTVEDDDDDDENSASMHGNNRSHNDQSRDMNHNQYEPTDDDDGQHDMR